MQRYEIRILDALRLKSKALGPMHQKIHCGQLTGFSKCTSYEINTEDERVLLGIILKFISVAGNTGMC